MQRQNNVYWLPTRSLQICKKLYRERTVSKRRVSKKIFPKSKTRLVKETLNKYSDFPIIKQRNKLVIDIICGVFHEETEGNF